MSNDLKQEPENEQPNDASEQTDADEAIAEKSRTKGTFAWVLVLILLLLIAAAGWVGYRYVYQELLSTNQQLEHQAGQQQKQLEQVQNELQQLSQQQQKLPQQVSQQLDQVADNLRRNVSDQAQELGDLQRSVRSVQAEFAALDVSQATAWRVLEARHLVEQASNKLYIDQQPKLALQLLELADSHLAALNNPAYQAARQAINDDKVVLRSLTTDAHVQVAMELSSLRTQLAEQQWQLSAPTRTLTGNAVSADAPWYERLQASAKTLFDQLIRVQHREKPIEPQLSMAFVELSKQRVLLQLQLAQQAALSQSGALYQASVSEAQRLISEVQTQSDLDLTALKSELDELATQSLEPDLPAQLRSLPVLNRLARALTAGVSQ
ncbi:uroporphyrinogen-III C-methyltransferase [Pseudidiomarina terrestris]|uniref:uroporphyrinogen-III C-methyltransferase n=1 Tax=Pseudidiomarina terrestris TaxID=2820060 RepID=UPI002655B24C|nr:uroporphyrinogen-III C-methyltransferase [Pseudidiomarina sp. 1ASP75-5]MDN7136406.1 uroporphyrinogen-III C-methyltransferase [Pseudidiomarina sp. 1ASP75-5]